MGQVVYLLAGTGLETGNGVTNTNGVKHGGTGGCPGGNSNSNTSGGDHIT